MRDILMILNEYRHGTPEVRLNLFLFHRDLRREFSEIEKEESASLSRTKKRFCCFSNNKSKVTFPFGIFKKRYQPA
jgi:hypothetical protein